MQGLDDNGTPDAAVKLDGCEATEGPVDPQIEPGGSRAPLAR